MCGLDMVVKRGSCRSEGPIRSYILANAINAESKKESP